MSTPTHSGGVNSAGAIFTLCGVLERPVSKSRDLVTCPNCSARYDILRLNARHPYTGEGRNEA